MKKHIFDFIRKGLSACGLGPLILAIIYLILQNNKQIESLTVNQVCIGIFSVSALAFIAGGMNELYKIERLPLMIAILIHGSVLYIAYLLTYLLNDWLEWGLIPIFVFSGIFVIGYLLIWIIIYTIVKKKTKQLNEILKQQQQYE